MDFSAYVRVLRNSWVLIAVIALISVGTSAVFTLVQQPKFEATSKVFVSAQGTTSVAEVQQGSNFTQARVSTYVNLVRTQAVLMPVIEALDLNTSSAELATKVSASAPLNTAIISIVVQDHDPVTAAAIADELAISLRDTVQNIETPMDGAESPVRLTQVQGALVPITPSSPNSLLNLGFGLIIGLAIAIGLAILREVLDVKIRNEQDLRDITDAPLLGGITFAHNYRERPLIVNEDPSSPRAEAFRVLRTNLQFIEFDGRKSFVVTSSIQSEGKSTTSANLAIAMADSGLRVMLVEADLRRSKLNEYLQLESGAGLSDLLAGRAQLPDLIQRWGRKNLYVLLGGTNPPNPSELLASPKMLEVVTQLEQAFDVVLFDMPPLLPVTDSAIVAKAVGGAIVVTAVGRVNKSELKASLETLNQIGAKVAGVVLTMIPTRGPDSYGYGRYGYGRYGYGNKATSKKNRNFIFKG